MVTKYEMLVNAIDFLCKLAPLNQSSYNMEDKSEEEINNIRSKGYIHLYLLIKFGIQNFEERHSFITDGPNDGGIDAYYIDNEGKTIYIIQSKYRTNEKNYENKEINPTEIVAMEIKSILQGKQQGYNGCPYNGRIKGMQKKISELSNRSLYDVKIIILANLYHLDKVKIMDALFKEYKYEIFDYKRAYLELVFPYCISTYYQNSLIVIDRNVKGIEQYYKESFQKTSYGKCTVILMFVPLRFVAEIVDKYKNSILQYNPRNYLSMSRNPVNKSISSALEQDNEDFALLNNGITMMCSDFDCCTQNGLDNSVNIHIVDPQIINGGQTGFTLSRMLYDKPEQLEGKKVLLRIIATDKEKKEANKSEEIRSNLKDAYNSFVGMISDSTNLQTKIEEADRRSNLLIQREMQKRIFDYYGLLYERKKGEFEEAIHNKIISNDQVIKRDTFVRCIWAAKGDCSKAMSDSKTELFSEENFNNSINSELNMPIAVYSYIIYTLVCQKEVKNKHAKDVVGGNGTRYGKYALVSAISMLSNDLVDEKKDLKELMKIAEKSLDIMINKWEDFENYVCNLNTNDNYFNKERNFYNYYKSQNVKKDVKEYWKDKRISEQYELIALV